jgi:rfaE bifunctional protein kinase chain/domain
MAPKSEFDDILKRFSGRRILIVGDLSLARFEFCRTVRFGHEAPTLVLRHEGEKSVAGWAGHVAANVAALGGIAIPVGVIGKDPAGTELLAALDANRRVDRAGLLVTPGHTTPVIKRIYGGGHNTNRRQVLRIDYEDRKPVGQADESQLLARVEALLPRVDGIYVADHGRGTMSRRLWMALHDGARRHHIHSVVDSGHNPLGFLGATVILQTEYEMVEFLREPEVQTASEAAVLARNLQRRAQAQAVILTRGNQGMVVVDGRKKPIQLGIYGPEEITDPTGVGETVGAATVLALAAGATVLEAARLASYAGGIAVMKPTLANVTIEELTRAAASRTL